MGESERADDISSFSALEGCTLDLFNLTDILFMILVAEFKL